MENIQELKFCQSNLQQANLFYKQFELKLAPKTQKLQNYLQKSILNITISTQYEPQEDYQDVQCSKRQRKYTNYTNQNFEEKSHKASIDEYTLNNLDSDSSKFQDQSSQKSQQNSQTRYKQFQSLINSKSQRNYGDKIIDSCQKILLQKHRAELQQKQGNKLMYGSNAQQKNICEQCIKKMHRLSSMELLKNEYYKSFLLIKNEVEQLKNNRYKQKQYQRSSVSLNDLIDSCHYDGGSQEKSEFSFQNIQNNLLNEKFVIEMQQFSIIIDKLLLVDINFIDISPEQLKFFEQLSKKIKLLKKHFGSKDDWICISQIKIESQNQIKTIHQKYKKLIQNINKNFRQKQNKMVLDFNKVNIKFIQTLKFNKQLAQQFQRTRQLINTPVSLRSIKSIKKAIVNQRKNSADKSLQMQKIQNFGTIFQQKNIQLQENLEKVYLKYKKLEKINKKNQKKIQQLNQLIAINKKRSLNEIYQFMQKMVKSPVHKTVNIYTKINVQQIEQSIQTITGRQLTQDSTQTDFTHKALKQKSFSDNHSFQIQEISQIVYEIFSYTSDDNGTQQNIFTPESKQELIEMLYHIRQFNKNFDVWQKNKQKQMLKFQKNFIMLIKFFIDSYMISEERLLQEVEKLKNMEPLKQYIHKYYQSISAQKWRGFSESSEFTFGKCSVRDISQIDS